ncbi:hypothetical protein MKW98_020479 [Papaver atlanticum]|uniref:SWIM-type domain-containing protein n=1 Tax=Papaver atlanticum TaxID=357466 RepID=A0AAD4X3H0_9MAGN|nr:hypothetical protein MKW98_020479 [Papaver atlanticum]
MINEDIPEVEPGKISTGMAFGSMQAYKDHLREYALLKHRDFFVRKGDRTRHYAYCVYKDSQKCAWMVNARKVPKKEDMTVTVRECNMEHTCKNPNEDYSRKCNAKKLAKYLLKTMDVGSPVDKAADIAKKIIRPQLQTDIPKHLYKNFLTKRFRNPRLTHLLWQAAKAYKYKHWEVMCNLRGKFHCDPSEERKVYQVTNKVTDKVFVVRIEERSCTCRQWQLRQFPCLNVLVALFKLNPDWSKYCSKYYTVDYYRTTYSWSITPLGDIDDYQNKTNINIIHPHRLRDKGRPCVKRKNNILTCQGPPIGSNPKKKGVRMECSVNGDEFCITVASTKKMGKALSAPTTATTSASKKSADIPPLSKGKAAATTPSSSSAGSQKRVPHPSTSSTPSTACFNQTYNGTVNISSQTINITEPSSKRVRKPNSKYQQ